MRRISRRQLAGASGAYGLAGPSRHAGPNRRKRVSHSCEARRYARSGWWAGVPQEGGGKSGSPALPAGRRKRRSYNPGMRTTAELREGFLSFFEEKGHLRRPSASLVPRADDRSTLLTSAGMQPQMPYFLGLEPAPAPTTTTVQKVFRTPDIDEVGLDTFHLTFFEMLGNFSFGQYFKEGAIQFAKEFMLDHLRLDWDRIWVSVHAGDPELKLGPDEVAIRLWEEVGMPPERIVPLPS